MRMSLGETLLLTEVVTKHRPDLLNLIHGRDLVFDERQLSELEEAVVEEMLTAGLQGPVREASLSPRGEALDDLAGRIRMSGIAWERIDDRRD